MTQSKTFNPWKLIQSVLFIMTLSTLALMSFSAKASDKADIDKILAMTTSPDGVVFELIGSENSTYLPNALTKIEAYKIQLKKKFPEIEIAIVAHGAEQFELTKDKAIKEKKTHNLVKRIVADDVPVHICETHASWRGVGAEEFPDYINVSAQGPIQIKQYQELGYLLVVVD